LLRLCRATKRLASRGVTTISAFSCTSSLNGIVDLASRSEAEPLLRDGTWRYRQGDAERRHDSVIDLGKVGGRAENSMPRCQAPRVPDFLTVEFTPSNDNCAPASQLMNFHEGSGESSRSTAPGGPFGLLSFFRRGHFLSIGKSISFCPAGALRGFLAFGDSLAIDIRLLARTVWRNWLRGFARSQPDAKQCPLHAR
jgi:hypothetical protein